MPTTYQKARPETVEILVDVMGLYHTELQDAGVTIDLLESRLAHCVSFLRGLSLRGTDGSRRRLFG